MLSINQRSTSVSAVIVALACSLLSPTAFAQTRILEEVIVTAQKRAQSSQDIPVAVSALSADMLEQAGKPKLKT